ncbi:hypothetical protein HRbin01_00709 [archaeon HR01]|nr:hypothetical protein HRbin01_00709 [archaeon HR01]
MPSEGLKPKPWGMLDVKVFTSEDRKQKFIVFKTPNGAYHVFTEVEAKDAAIKCGMKMEPTRANTRQFWDKLWKEGKN